VSASYSRRCPWTCGRGPCCLLAIFRCPSSGRKPAGPDRACPGPEAHFAAPAGLRPMPPWPIPASHAAASSAAWPLGPWFLPDHSLRHQVLFLLHATRITHTSGGTVRWPAVTAGASPRRSLPGEQLAGPLVLQERRRQRAPRLNRPARSPPYALLPPVPPVRSGPWCCLAGARKLLAPDLVAQYPRVLARTTSGGTARACGVRRP